MKAFSLSSTISLAPSHACFFGEICLRLWSISPTYSRAEQVVGVFIYIEREREINRTWKKSLTSRAYEARSVQFYWILDDDMTTPETYCRGRWVVGSFDHVVTLLSVRPVI